MNKDLLKIARKTFLLHEMFEYSPEECGYMYIKHKNNYFVYAKNESALKSACNYLTWQKRDVVFRHICVIATFLSLGCLFINCLPLHSTLLEFIGMAPLILIGTCYPFYEIISGHKKEKYKEKFQGISKFIPIPINVLNDIKNGRYEEKTLKEKK